MGDPQNVVSWFLKPTLDLQKLFGFLENGADRVALARRAGSGCTAPPPRRTKKAPRPPKAQPSSGKFENSSAGKKTVAGWGVAEE